MSLCGLFDDDDDDDDDAGGPLVGDWMFLLLPIAHSCRVILPIALDVAWAF